MSTHTEILAAARRIARDRRDWTFRPDEIVRALPHLNPGTIKTHVTSRCCVNAPTNHPHKWDYFTRLSRGVYELHPKYRVGEVREARADDGAPARSRTRRTIRCIVRRSAAGYRAECIDVPVVALGGTLDETVAHLREAIAGRLEAEDPVNLAITFEEPLATRPSISTLARRIIARNRHGETDWGKRMGRESW